MGVDLSGPPVLEPAKPAKPAGMDASAGQRLGSILSTEELIAVQHPCQHAISCAEGSSVDFICNLKPLGI